ncbi:aminotransferase [Xylona heveae TC161]|uniref:Aminotransferase n=1 Tax=Xylona heveae (strain CBS 132557 / TC161) TaxID=1328760 RepID=A0A165HVK2_XYLHT|nr:aminotransferase [Xylona heveae TC161]KZF23982.1 aminotransferase [Xylona heveae TC161]
MAPATVVSADPAPAATKPTSSTSTKQAATTAGSSNVFHNSTLQDPHTVVAADRHHLILANGQRVLDATGGAAVACIGQSDQRVKQAIAEQLDKVQYCHALFFGNTPSEELANELIDSTGGKMAKVFIVSSGSEAMEAAMKLTRQYFVELSQPQRTQFIARHESYHGITLGALSMGGHKFRRELFKPMLLNNISHVSPCNPYRGKHDGESDEAYVARLARELDDEFQRLGPENVCAFVAEPVVGAALGCVPSVPGYFRAVKSVCDKYGALLIMDEVMCGMGRTGTLHAWQQEDGVVPDIQTIGKGLGAGYMPIAAVMANQKVVDAFNNGTGSFRHGQTYQGHAIASAAALAVQRIIKSDGLLPRAQHLGNILSSVLIERLASHPFVGNIRGRGLFWGIEFVADKKTKEPFDLKEKISMAVHDRGLSTKWNISLFPGTGTADGYKGDHILLAPPYTLTDEEMLDLVHRAVGVVEEEFRERGLV